MNDPQIIFQQIRQLKLTQDDIKKKKFEAKGDGFEVIVSGDMKIQELKLPAKISADDVKKLKNLINKALQKAQKSTLEELEKISS